MLLNPSQVSKSRKEVKREPSMLKFELMLEDTPPPSKKRKPMTAFAKRPTFITPTGLVQCSPEHKSPKKTTENTVSAGNVLDDRLWSDKYEPTTEADLAVHKRKVENVRNWFVEAFEGGPSGKLRQYRRILALTGPAGTGKTTTVRVLARELGFDILEWKNPIDGSFARDEYTGDSSVNQWESVDYEGQSEKFKAFLFRAARCQNIFGAESSNMDNVAESSSTPQSAASNTGQRRQVVVLEDLPNILHPQTRAKFHSALEAVVHTADQNSAPIVIIISDAGVRGETADEKQSQGFGSWGKEAVDIRTVLPPSLFKSIYVTQIAFNPIAPTLLRKALQAHFSTPSSSSQQQRLPKDALDLIVETSNGDIRSAIMALQFALVIQPRDRKGKKALRGGHSMRKVLDAVTRREQSLALFHLMGKVLYNKRKGDPPSSSMKAKDIDRERELDVRLKDAFSHPSFLAIHDRRASRVDVDTLYADTPIDSSLFSLYIHQNYPQFCDTMDQCHDVVEWLSWVDSSGGEAWYQSNPHCFHLLALGTLHSLPSPVQRRSQKILKPEFFHVRAKEMEARGGLEDVGRWIMDPKDSITHGKEMTVRWTLADVATDAGGVLRARECTGAELRPPASHRLFSHLVFIRGDETTGAELEEEDRENTMAETGWDSPEFERRHGVMNDSVAPGWWLESDDIEYFEE